MDLRLEYVGGFEGGAKGSIFDLHRTCPQVITSGDSHVNSTFNLLKSQVHTSVQDPVHTIFLIQCIAVALENYFPIPCKVSCPYAYFVRECMRMGTRLCKEWENNFPTQLQYTVMKLS